MDLPAATCGAFLFPVPQPSFPPKGAGAARVTEVVIKRPLNIWKDVFDR